MVFGSHARLTMSSLCNVCNKSIDCEKEEECTQCDGCEIFLHLRCHNIKQKEINGRKNSKCVRLYCPDCIDKKDNNTAEKLKDVMKLLYKLDLFNQEQKIQNAVQNDTIKTISEKLDHIEKVVGANSMNCGISGINNNNIGQQQASQSYACVTKKNSVKPAVVIIPKNKQDSKKTFEAVTTNVNKNDVNVCGTRNVRDGGIVLRCVNTTETMKVKQLINEKLGDD